MAEESPIKYFDRYLAEVRHEQIYGEGWLRWVYGNPLGRMTLWAFFSRPFFSKWYGKRMSSSSSCSKIEPFVRDYELDTTEFAETVSSYTSFNDFFSRRLKPEARPIAGGELAAFPADGRHLGFPDLSTLSQVFSKGQSLNFTRLFGSEETASQFSDGTLVISRLCPVDYHRFHFPVSGEAKPPSLIRGDLKSVNPIALRRNLAILWGNKRFLSFIESDSFGRVACIEIGATCVGSVHYLSLAPTAVSKGDEKGWFSFGGSMTMTFFQKGKIQLADDLLAQSASGLELYARMGDQMGSPQ
ncbi:MAG: phosphatidylserine decarboxylase [Opitutae bacterium]|nr:phosphatidylserine decarboxylase [Opitutae bacterium]